MGFSVLRPVLATLCEIFTVLYQFNSCQKYVYVSFWFLGSLIDAITRLVYAMAVPSGEVKQQ
jgi:hypothetical protein